MCVLVEICVSSISLYKLDTDKLTAPFESAHQFTLVCTVSDSKTVPGCHYIKSQFCSDLLTPPFVCSERFSHSLDTLYPWCTLICAYCDRGQGRFIFVLRALRKCSCHSPSMLDPPPMIEYLELHACSVRIKGRHALKWGTCSNSNTEQQHSIQWQDREQAWFQASGTW